MKLIVGLGNPGPRYAGNRHNIGFMAIEALARRQGLGPFRRKFQGQIAEGTVGGERVLLLCPDTFMNRSGQAVGEAARFHKIDLADIIVVHDDLDLAPGKVKIKQGGGHGGHNGLRDIDAHLGPDYWRVRLGIGHPGDKNRVTGYVLDDFSKADQAWLGPLLDAVADTLPLVVQGRPSDAMSKIAAALAPPRPHHPRPEPEKPTESSPAGASPSPSPASGPDAGPVGAPAQTDLAAALARALALKTRKGTG
ncbi:aminoacyl-tRNA hydrolase [Pararhodospirillum oryzae]|uniref:Peptidyl-tRNA hydrolase n=1 Tax=Pararhodospirillum oryzae TaxID=478448 RepID=A0A512HAF5_9PROT|nr:aminoacyl-tRNA hydrolase [Pararhodospirillum oryzae]GEO82408.1 peptidyl-tRNA hydrolase [Pararhodospirillum oryzae]